MKNLSPQKNKKKILNGKKSIKFYNKKKQKFSILFSSFRRA